MTFRTLICIVALFSLSSCATSLVYSPSIGLTAESLKKGEIDLNGGLILLPETRPSSIGRNTVLGGEGHISYGFTDKFALQVKGWVDMQIKNQRSGFSLAGIKTIKETNNLRLLIMPKVGCALSGNSLDGFGLELPVILQYDENTNASIFIGLGAAFGFRGLYKLNKNGGFATGIMGEDNQYPFGYAGLIHSGLTYKITKNLRLNLEFSSIYQLNIYDKQSHFLLAPNFSIGYVFPNKK
jgi:hypothetical protein